MTSDNKKVKPDKTKLKVKLKTPKIEGKSRSSKSPTAKALGLTDSSEEETYSDNEKEKGGDGDVADMETKNVETASDNRDNVFSGEHQAKNVETTGSKFKVTPTGSEAGKTKSADEVTIMAEKKAPGKSPDNVAVLRIYPYHHSKRR